MPALLKAQAPTNNPPQGTAPALDTSSPKGVNNLHYPISDRRGDDLSNPSKRPVDLKKPSNINDSIVYDPESKRYIIFEKVGDKYYRSPVSYSFDEYWLMVQKKQEKDYFNKLSNTTLVLNRGVVKPKLSIYDNLFNRLFGNGKINITPQGSVGVTAGYQGQNVNNPTLPERARKNGGFDFNMQSQLNVNADIGGKLKFPISYNTLANFGQDNQLKLDYTGIGDEIVKKFELGNVAFPSHSSLIPGAQQLFGAKIALQFGKLFITAVVANQKSTQQTANLQGNSAAQVFTINADAYEENRHFLLSQYFRANFNKVMSNLPAINSPIRIMRMEVWVTNRNGAALNTRSVVGLANLGETNAAVPLPPDNKTSQIFNIVTTNSLNRDPSQVYNNLAVTRYNGVNLQPTVDFEMTYARKLDSTQYRYDPQIGYISLMQPLQPTDVLAVAYQYSYNGKIIQVGEFSQDLPPDSSDGTQQVLFLKLLKGTVQQPNQPIWNLMMKNVYSIGTGTLSSQDFKLDVLYNQPGLGQKRYVPFGNKNLGTPLISLLNLDRLNSNNDPQPDGVFDYVEGYTVFSQYSRIMFPVLQPFGRDLAANTYSNPNLASLKDTLYYALYDSIKAVAQQYANLNHFQLKGSAKITGGGDISIGYNIPQGSATVTAGGRVLTEGVDYIINYDLGTVKIINTALANSGTPIQVKYENNANFGLQQRSYTGLRFDYNIKNTIKNQLSVGGTMVRLGERPFFNKTALGEDPIRNTLYGLDVNWKKDLPRLTKVLNKLPFYQTKEPSTLTVTAEGAYFKPGHAPQIGKGGNGASYIDDFEGSTAGIDLRFPQTNWALASTPKDATDANGNILFPEADLTNNLDYGKNRARLAWYQIDPSLQTWGSGSNNPITDPIELSDPRVRQVHVQEVFPQTSVQLGGGNLQTFDMSYYPTEKGPYNYDDKNILSSGKLTNPAKRWGGMMRALDQTDFVTANIEYIEFWMQDPYINSPLRPNAANSTGGQLYFNLGFVSEDILKDGKRLYENGLKTPNAPAALDSSAWGYVPGNPIQITNAFSNDPNDRPYQDLGLDGMNDADEARVRASYLRNISGSYGANSQAYLSALADPSSDDYHNYRGSDYDAAKLGILGRYKKYSNPEGNSPIATTTDTYTSASTMYPDAEDLNHDNTLNQTEAYFQYTVNIKPANDPAMNVGQNFIVNKISVTPTTVPGSTPIKETWYQFKIPIEQYNKAIGGISNFNSIQFIRMFLTGFTDSVTLRFGELQLTRNSWRNYQFKIDTTGNYTALNPGATSFDVAAVSIETDGKRSPIPYATPIDVVRQQTLSTNGVTLLQNEQSMTLKVCNLAKGDARGVFQTYPNRDLRQFGTMQMYIHAEKDITATLNNKDLTAVIRIGTDFANNYYQIRIPLNLTGAGVSNMNTSTAAYSDTLWPASNSLLLNLQSLVQLKEKRNADPSATLNKLYPQKQSNGQEYSVMGNPNLGQVAGIMIAVENTNQTLGACGQVWVDELRVTSMDEQGGYATISRADLRLADLGTISVSANNHTAGFGNLDSKVSQRYQDNFLQFDATANLELGKLLPKKAAVSIPVYANYTQSVSKPKYDPFDMDITLKNKIASAKTAAERDSIKVNAIDFTSTTTLNFTNVHKNRVGNKKPKIYDIENFNFSYSYVNTKSHNPTIEYNQITRHNASLGYLFAPKPNYITPFKKIFTKTKTHWFDLVKDFNFNLIPSTFSFRTSVSQQFAAIRPRSIGASEYKIPTTYDKYFTMQRDYIFRWNLTKSLNLDFTAQNKSRVDQPDGALDTKAKRDSMWNNFFKGGRNTFYQQAANITYTVPTAKFPLLDWTQVNVKYQATYNWIGASLLAQNLGNIVENGNQQEATAQLDFNKLYQKSKWLKQLNQTQNIADREKWRNRITKVKDSVLNKQGQKVVKTRRIVDKSAVPYLSVPERIFGKLLTSFKQASFSISENANTRLPGYTDSSKIIGQNWKSMQPGLGFIFGKQPDTTWLNSAGRKGLVTKDTSFNMPFTQVYNQNITFSAQLEPVRDLRISLNLKKTFAKNYSETYRYTDTSGGRNYQFGHYNPYAGGGFDISYISYKTLFTKIDPNHISQIFEKFQNYRMVLSERLGKLNPYSKQQAAAAGQSQVAADGYYYGYNRYASDVIIPAFIAAYTGKDPKTISLLNENNPNIKSNPFSAIIPKLNWKLDYTGLTRIKGFERIFTSFNISHAYTGNLSMDGFTSALNYADISKYSYPSFYDSTSRNFVPFFLIPNVNIKEGFAPLIGIDVKFKNQMQFNMEYAKSRSISLSLIDYQLAEVNTTSFSIGFGYRKKGLKMPFNITLPKILQSKSDVKNGQSKLGNEINFKFDFKISNNINSNSFLDQVNNYTTGGSKDITIMPTIDYYLSSRVQIKFYYEQRRVIPYISSSAPTTNTRAGLQVNISLSQ